MMMPSRAFLAHFSVLLPPSSVAFLTVGVRSEPHGKVLSRVSSHRLRGISLGIGRRRRRIVASRRGRSHHYRRGKYHGRGRPVDHSWRRHWGHAWRSHRNHSGRCVHRSPARGRVWRLLTWIHFYINKDVYHT
jgi:hypothetical protein